MVTRALGKFWPNLWSFVNRCVLTFRCRTPPRTNRRKRGARCNAPLQDPVHHLAAVRAVYPDLPSEQHESAGVEAPSLPPCLPQHRRVEPVSARDLGIVLSSICDRPDVRSATSDSQGERASKIAGRIQTADGSFRPKRGSENLFAWRKEIRDLLPPPLWEFPNPRTAEGASKLISGGQPSLKRLAPMRDGGDPTPPGWPRPEA